MPETANFPAPTLRQVDAARREYEANEPRDLFYRAATQLVDLALRRKRS